MTAFEGRGRFQKPASDNPGASLASPTPQAPSRTSPVHKQIHEAQKCLAARYSSGGAKNAQVHVLRRVGIPGGREQHLRWHPHFLGYGIRYSHRTSPLNSPGLPCNRPPSGPCVKAEPCHVLRESAVLVLWQQAGSNALGGGSDKHIMQKKCFDPPGTLWRERKMESGIPQAPRSMPE